MNIVTIAEKAANAIGRIKGQYLAGMEKANPFSTSWTEPKLTDASAWIDPQSWGQALISGRKPQTKQEFIAAFTSWVYICVKHNAQGVASVPLRLYVAKETKGKAFKTIQTRAVNKEKMRWLYRHENLDPWLTKAQEIEEVTEHPFLDLMKNVNDFANRRDLWESTVMFMDLTGEAYWYIPPSKLAVPSQIWVIPAQWINPKFGTGDKIIDHYEYKRGSAEADFPPEQIVMFIYPNPSNIFTGFASVRGIADAVYLQMKMNEFEESLMENKARMGGIMVPKGRMTQQDKERMEQKFAQKFAGTGKAGKILIPNFEMDFIRDSMTPEEINFIEGRRFNRTEICAGLDVPEAIFVSESSNRAVADAAEYQHAKYGINPRCKRIEEKINERIMPLYDEKLFCAFDDAVPENRELKLMEQDKRINRSKTINEIRAENGDGPIEGGDDIYVDSMQIPVGSTAVAKQAEAFAEKVAEAIERKLG